MQEKTKTQTFKELIAAPELLMKHGKTSTS
jgi:hypothetical protein